jgi:hypothetical protein
MKKYLLLTSLFLIQNIIISNAQLRWGTTYNNFKCGWATSFSILDGGILVRNGIKSNGVYGIKYTVHNKNDGVILFSDSFSNLNSQIFTNSVIYYPFDAILKHSRKIFTTKAGLYHTLDSSNYITYLSIFDPITFVSTNKVIGDSGRSTFCNSIIEISANKLAIGYTSKDKRYDAGYPSRFGLMYIDTFGNILFKDTFASKEFELFINMVKDKNDNIYMCGSNSIYPFSQYNFENCVKKIAPNGTLLLNKFISKRGNHNQGFINNISNSNGPNFVVINAQARNPYGVGGYFGTSNMLNFTYLDSNVNITHIDSFYRDYYCTIWGTKTLRNGDILIFGRRWDDTINSNYEPEIGWATRVDSLGKIKWDRMYILRDSVHHNITDAEEDTDGSIYFSGVSGPKDTIILQSSMLIRVDSNGCLDSTFCYPLGIREITKIPDAAIQLYPNPARNNITLLLNDAQYIGGQASIYTTEGKLVARLNKVVQKQVIDVQGYATGNYYLQYSVGDWRGGVMFRVE